MGMRHWCMLGTAFLLLVCQVIVHQLCETLIALVDGFHTVFIMVRMASMDSSAPPAHSSPTLHAEPRTESPPGTHTSTVGSLIRDQPAPPLEGASLADSHQLFTSEVSPPPLNCGLSFTHSRTEAVGAFISALVLTSLCLSNITEIISFSLDPHPVQRPLLPVLVGAVSMLYKMLMLWLNWDQIQAENKSFFKENHRVSAEKKDEGQTDPRQALDDLHEGQSPVEGCLHNGALVLSNPGMSRCISDEDSQTPKPEPGVHLHTAGLQVDRNCKDQGSSAGLSPSNETAEVSEDNSCMGQLGSKYICKSSPACLLSSILITQGLCSPLFALINSLVTLLIDPQCLHSSGACALLVYLDPGLSLFAVITLIATAMPQVHRYGMLLLQSTPPHICVSDLGQRIATVPGVEAVHDLHVWQLNGSLTVASVHVHCHAGFPLHRCADLLSGVTKVLQSVGVSCCTVQPEFTSYPESFAGSASDASPIIHREDPTLPPQLPLACSLACGKACTGNMCCTPPEEESRSLLTPPAGETKEEPQTLIIENTFL
ncbi:proton-coupled zinc antiporter SLC30A1 isoform X1 [Halichoeres trimaculatus]|uniref:proton-coupled zinc antiporter SLC30A1 isoform X1 n=1 Tax=Halichoeres trimaculatus TaxID=147232 RepID=UPI003D9F5399